MSISVITVKADSRQVLMPDGSVEKIHRLGFAIQPFWGEDPWDPDRMCKRSRSVVKRCETFWERKGDFPTYIMCNYCDKRWEEDQWVYKSSGLKGEVWATDADVNMGYIDAIGRLRKPTKEERKAHPGVQFVLCRKIPEGWLYDHSPWKEI